MPHARSGTTSTGSPIHIEYETFGDRRDPALLLVAGWSVQMLAWDAELKAAADVLRDRPEHADVVRFLEHQITVASHNAYCGTPTPFAVPGVRRS